MPLTADTSLAKALRADPELAERLTGRLGPDNPLSRLLAAGNLPVGRIHFADAAAIAGLPVDTLLMLAAGPAAAASEPAPAPAAAASGNDWFAQAERSGAAIVDVRPLLAEGQDPFASVLQASATVEPGGFLMLDAPFDPAPLRRVLAGKGFMSVGRPVEPGHWRICFRRDGSAADDSVFDPPALRKPGETWREGAALHVDVRGMTPPGPLTAVLRLVEAGEAEEIVVHHDRDPMLLYPELEERGWECVTKTAHGDEVRLLLRPISE
ncbi:DUF2249 domain-containing protein [Azospirillum sp. sgz301742]